MGFQVRRHSHTVLLSLIISHFLSFVMSGVKPITSYFKVMTKDELEIKELQLESQSSSLSRVISNQSARTRSTLSTKVYDSYIDLTKEPEESLPALADYSSDDGDNDDGSNSTINVLRSGGTLNPSKLHGGIQPNRYSTVA